MDSAAIRLEEFVRYVRTHLTGDEKGEAHLFCERLFQAFASKDSAATSSIDHCR